jgi:hypothetical protein
LFHLCKSATALLGTCNPGLRPPCTASRAGSSATPGQGLSTSPSPSATYPTSISIWPDRNLLQVCGLRCVKCLASPTARLQLTTQRRTMQRKDCSNASKTQCVHEPLLQPGPMRSLGFSLASDHNPGRTQVFPHLKQFMVCPLFYQMSFCRLKNFL